MIRLREYTPTECVLAEADARFLLQRLAGSFDVTPTSDRQNWLINPKQFVGVMLLPSGQTLVVEPKVPVRNVFQMFAVANGLTGVFRQELARLEDISDLIELVVMHFVDLVNDRIRRGLYRDYVEREDNLGTVRGRIVIHQQIQQNAILQHRMYCRFTEFTHDIPENQIIRQVVHLLSLRVVFPGMRLKLQQLDATLADVAPTNLTVHDLDRMHYHRLNDDYQPIHRLCRLFMELLSLEHQSGETELRAFFIDMNALFEAFIAAALRNTTPAGGRVETQVKRKLDDGNSVSIKPDLLLGIGGREVLIADTKYKDVDLKGTSNADLFQMTAYCLTQNVPDGLLIYPANAGYTDAVYAIRNSGIRVRAVTVDLGMPPDQFTLRSIEIGTRIWAIVQTANLAPLSLIA
jgi:5-methylcytosine-specific restriction enzyme subunit McrC